MYISQLVKTRDPYPGLLTITILSPSFPFHLFYWPETSLYFIITIISIYYLSILVEVLLRLLTYRGDLVLLYLVSEYHS
jgi:hypothetical protein